MGKKLWASLGCFFTFLHRSRQWIHGLCAFGIQGNLATKFPLKTLVVMGIGGSHGALYKREALQVLRSCAGTLIACDLPTNPLAKGLHGERIIDFFVPVSSANNLASARTDLFDFLEKENIVPDALVSLREEWLQVTAFLAQALGLPHQSLEVIQRSQDKHQARTWLANHGMQEQLRYTYANFEDLTDAAKTFGFPFFIKPRSGVRSEFACHIKDQDTLTSYMRSIKPFPLQYFVLEEVLQGHEVDVDIVLHQGNLLYGTVSDNFPVFYPYALETGQLSPSLLPTPICDAIIAKAYEVAKTLGYVQGVLHVECMLTPEGAIHLIELNGRVGGMYIASWHKNIWGVDLIKAQVAIAAGQDPTAFLTKQNPDHALALFCITSNTLGAPLASKTVSTHRWINKEAYESNAAITSTELWDALPLSANLAISGHPNIGAITVKASTPLAAFTKLMQVFQATPPILDTSEDTRVASLYPLYAFCANTPCIARFPPPEKPRKATYQPYKRF